MENTKSGYTKMFKDLKTGKFPGGKIIIDYTTAFETAFTYFLSSCIILLCLVVFTAAPGVLTGNPGPYLFWGGLILAGGLIRFNLSCYAVADTISQKLIFERRIFSKVFQPVIINFSEIIFVGVSGYPSKSSGLLNDYRMLLILKDGTTVRMGNPVWLRDIPGNKSEVMELASLFNSEFIEPVADNSIVVLSTPVLNRESIGYREIHRVNMRAFLVMLAAAVITVIAAAVIAFFIK